jgi:hypothetical protein
MSTEIICIVEESAEGGFEAKAFDHSIYTEADTLEGIKSMVKDAVQRHFDEKDRPKLIRLHFVKDEVIAGENSTGIERGRTYSALGQVRL